MLIGSCPLNNISSTCQVCHRQSEEELRLLDKTARALGKKARVALRVNPDVDPHTHKHITTGKKGTKFGMAPDRVFPPCTTKFDIIV